MCCYNGICVGLLCFEFNEYPMDGTRIICNALQDQVPLNIYVERDMLRNLPIDLGRTQIVVMLILRSLTYVVM